MVQSDPKRSRFSVTTTCRVGQGEPSPEMCRGLGESQSGDVSCSGQAGTRDWGRCPWPGKLDSRGHGFREMERLDRVEVRDQVRLLILFDGSAASRQASLLEFQ